MREILDGFLVAVQLVLLIMMGLPVLYLLFFAIAGLFYNPGASDVESTNFRRIAVLIPGYREDAVIVNVASCALQQDYPEDKFGIFIIADSFLPETVAELKKMPVRVIEVVFDKSTKVKSLRRAMQKVDPSFDIVVILDADNLMEDDFLKKINAAFDKSFLVVQGHRKAANLDTSMAILDAASEEINNHIFRKGHRAAGLSSAIIGSGMAFQADYFRELMHTASAVGGFDKELELNILRNHNVIEYIDNAIVYDEKIRKADAFEKQRRRWLSSQFYYLRKDFFKAAGNFITTGNIDYFDKIIQFLLPPRIILLGGVIIFSAFFIPYDFMSDHRVSMYLWIALAALYLDVFIISVPAYFYNMKTLKALVSLPRGMYLMLLSLFRIKGANREFIHTVHGTTVKTKT